MSTKCIVSTLLRNEVRSTGRVTNPPLQGRVLLTHRQPQFVSVLQEEAEAVMAEADCPPAPRGAEGVGTMQHSADDEIDASFEEPDTLWEDELLEELTSKENSAGTASSPPGRKTNAEVREAHQILAELEEWIQHDWWAHRVNSGQVILDEQERAMFEWSAQRAEEILFKYGADAVGGDDYALGVKRGRLLELAWMLGADSMSAGEETNWKTRSSDYRALRPRRFAPYQPPTSALAQRRDVK